MNQHHSSSSGPAGEPERPFVPSIEQEVSDLRQEIARLTAVVTRLTAQRGRRMDSTDIVICVLIVAWAAMVVLPLFAGGGS